MAPSFGPARSLASTLNMRMDTSDSPDSKGARSRERRLGALALGVLAAAGLLASYAVHASMPTNPIRLPFERALAPIFVALAPESWKFFTRDPQEARYWVYVRRAQRWESANLGPNGRASNWFGASRVGRAQGLELGIILEESGDPETFWTTCDAAERSACLDRAETVPYTLTSSSPAPTLCGEIGLVHQQFLPWAWAKHPERNRMPMRVLKVRVTC
jgi:antimicrobial peptide system SdpA family protein